MDRSSMEKVWQELEGQDEETLSRVADRLEALEAEANVPRRSLRGQSRQRAALDDLASVPVFGEA
ncbi:MAG: hypothetical protein EpisKO_04830 [Epibacterium sp.]